MSLLENPTIVVPFDFSDAAAEAVVRALQLTSPPDNVHVVHVGRLPTAYEPAGVWSSLDEHKMNESLREAFAAQAQRRGFPPVRFEVEFGDPGTQIAQYASDRDVDLIVIPSQGRRGLPRWLIGSVAERVVRLAPCPVLVLRCAEEETP